MMVNGVDRFEVFILIRWRREENEIRSKTGALPLARSEQSYLK